MSLDVKTIVLTGDQILLSTPSIALTGVKAKLLDISSQSKGFVKVTSQIAGRAVQVLAILTSLPALIYSIAKGALLLITKAFTMDKFEAINKFYKNSGFGFTCMFMALNMADTFKEFGNAIEEAGRTLYSK